MPFQQRHERLYLVDERTLVIACKEAEQPGLPDEWLALRGGHLEFVDDSCETARFGFRRGDKLLDEVEEVVAHPWHTKELESVGAFVEREPESKLGWPELVRPFYREDVGSDQVDGVPVQLRGQRQFVLPQNPSGHHTEKRSRLDGNRPPRQKRCPLPDGAQSSESLGQTILDRIHEVSEELDVAGRPLRSRNDAYVRCSHRRKSCRFRYEGLCPGDELGSLQLQDLLVVGVLERIGAGDPAGDTSRQIPWNGAGTHGLLSEAGLVLFEERPEAVQHFLPGLFLNALSQDHPEVLLEMEPARAAFAPTKMPGNGRSMSPTHLVVEVEIEVGDCVFASTSTHGRHL